jgi:hypothetical protein
MFQQLHSTAQLACPAFVYIVVPAVALGGSGSAHDRCTRNCGGVTSCQGVGVGVETFRDAAGQGICCPWPLSSHFFWGFRVAAVM